MLGGEGQEMAKRKKKKKKFYQSRVAVHDSWFQFLMFIDYIFILDMCLINQLNFNSTLFLSFFFFSFLPFSRAAPTAYGGSQARGRIGAVASGLRQSHNNAGSKPRLQPTPQLMATPDP